MRMSLTGPSTKEAALEAADTPKPEAEIPPGLVESDMEPIAKEVPSTTELVGWIVHKLGATLSVEPGSTSSQQTTFYGTLPGVDGGPDLIVLLAVHERKRVEEAEAEGAEAPETEAKQDGDLL
jgi:hypothetical protein